MEHADHVKLLRSGIPETGGIWADFGSGTGAFTLALADLIGPTGQIYSIDERQGALKQQQRALRVRFPEVAVHYRVADFTKRLDLPSLAGIVMANALHFHRDKDAIVQLLQSYLKPGGRFILVEYDTDRSNRWVPYPLSYPTWESMAKRNGFVNTQLLETVPSSFLGRIYAALSEMPAVQ